MIEGEVAPAKINLAQDILFRRDDQYHEVAMVMASIDLSDYLTFELIPENKIIVETSRAFLPEDNRNHAFQAAQLMKKVGNIQSGVHISIEKRIPVAAGLGGGSTDAAAVFRKLNTMWDMNLPLSELQALASRVGSDVAYSIAGGTALVEGRGEKISLIQPAPKCWIILAKPAISVSTRKIFQQLDIDRLKYEPNTPKVLAALENGSYDDLMAAIGNSLEGVTFSQHPQLARLKQQMLHFGADGVTMSGSGPTIIGFTQVYSRGHRIYNALRGFCQEVYMVRVMPEPFEQFKS
ncbi:4-(cytidine 5'-diphospho)-2-C-methyl-D-erythritol kinase [Aerococcus agrisoli]|uniref:4-diphosphocytidyl-2-C-methyl-D-erythritol kinase n=1 Tax=Aerococcus agrisoli TaxID=2487350 RepID=A0A3N4GH84_9LACT|nr:4-(cytidine 5'-diphospho)-2-C-methyl-D-erythritol kinase [Aerococcus agrisoli]RPA60787.1 4-(cytidine 5'-diphospho)-2-C-methyl-D-erythritol kinase [Aerococcus agrisoli]